MTHRGNLIVVLLAALAVATACGGLPERPPSDDRIRITGSVVDDATSKPMESVCISGGKPGDCTWKTDAQGLFRIDGLVPAEWHFFFEKTDYQTQRVELVIKGGETRDLSIRLKSSKEQQ